LSVGRKYQFLAPPELSASSQHVTIRPPLCSGFGYLENRAARFASAPLGAAEASPGFAPYAADLLVWHRPAEPRAAAKVFPATAIPRAPALDRFAAFQEIEGRRPRGHGAHMLAGGVSHGQARPSSDQHPEHLARSRPVTAFGSLLPAVLAAMP
jgi:hypothetical protein